MKNTIDFLTTVVVVVMLSSQNLVLYYVMSKIALAYLVDHVSRKLLAGKPLTLETLKSLL